MIVRCERCETRFKLDESRLPARGARVRCSRCKHAFFVTPPGAAQEELVHEVAAAAARSAGQAPRAPEPSWDLEENPDATVSRRAPGAPARAQGAEPEEEHSDWRFEDDVPGLDLGATRSSAFDLSGSQPAPALVAPPDANEDSFAGLGDPETWDLLAGDAPPAAPPASVEPPPEAAAPPKQAPPTPAAAPSARAEAPSASPPAPASPNRPRVSAVPARSAFAPPPIVMARRIPAAPRSLSTATWAGWAGLALLVAAIAWGSLRPATPVAGPVTLAPVSGFEVREARALIVDNRAAGPILVVSGTLRNPGPSARALSAPLEVRLLDDDGAALAGLAAPAGPALPEARVREEAPERLLAGQEASAARLAREQVAAGAELGFAAIFAPVPREASRFALATGGAAR